MGGISKSEETYSSVIHGSIAKIDARVAELIDQDTTYWNT